MHASRNTLPFGKLTDHERRTAVEAVLDKSLQQGNTRRHVEGFLAGSSRSDIRAVVQGRMDEILELLADLEVRTSATGPKHGASVPAVSELIEPVAGLLVWFSYVEHCAGRHSAPRNSPKHGLPECVVREMLAFLDARFADLQARAEDQLKSLLDSTSLTGRVGELTGAAVSQSRIRDHVGALLRELGRISPWSRAANGHGDADSEIAAAFRRNPTLPDSTPASRLAVWALSRAESFVEQEARSAAQEALAKVPPLQRAAPGLRDNLVLLHLFYERATEDRERTRLWMRLRRHCPWLEFESFDREFERHFDPSLYAASDREERSGSGAGKPPTADFDFAKLPKASRERMSASLALENWLLLPQARYRSVSTDTQRGTTVERSASGGLAGGSYYSLGTFLIKNRFSIRERALDDQSNKPVLNDDGEEDPEASEIADPKSLKAPEYKEDPKDPSFTIQVPLGLEDSLRHVLGRPGEIVPGTDPSMDRLNFLVGEVPTDDRAILALAICENLTSREIGERLGVSSDNARQRKSRALRFLNQKWQAGDDQAAESESK
ncbi:MAG: sigma factor-like helix-turn-helix DNA-binding protein [Limisphaerales bacterium]